MQHHSSAGLRTVATGLLLVAVVLVIGLFVLIPAAFLLTGVGFLVYPPLGRSAFLLWGALGATPAYGAVLFVPRLRRWVTAPAHFSGQRLTDVPRVVLHLLVAFAVFLSPLVLANGLVLVNGVLDRSPEVSHDTAVLEKRRSGGGRSAVSYTLRVQGWAPEAPWYDLRVSRTAFDAARVLGPVRLTTRRGRLGQEWVSSYRVGPSAPAAR